MTEEQFVRSAGALLTGNPNIGNAVNQRGFIKSATFNPSGRATAEAVRLGAAPANPFALQGYTPPAVVSTTPVSGTIKGGNER